MTEFLPAMAGLVSSSLLAGGVLALAGTGETIGQRAGIFNLGMEGVMAVGAIIAIVAVQSTGSLSFAVAAAALLGILLGLAFAVCVVLIRVDQVVAGLAFAFLGTGLSAWLGAGYAGTPAVASFGKQPFPVLSGIPFLGEALFDLPLPTYAAFFILPALAWWFLERSRAGLSLRAVGESPSAADAVGIPVIRWRFAALAFGGMMSALSGAYLTLVFVPTWSNGLTGGRGWIALALVIFAGFRPVRLAAAAFFFGLITAIGFSAQVWGLNVPSALLSALPYLATLGVMLSTGLSGQRRSRRPAALGLPFYREER